MAAKKSRKRTVRRKRPPIQEALGHAHNDLRDAAAHARGGFHGKPRAPKLVAVLEHEARRLGYLETIAKLPKHIRDKMDVETVLRNPAKGKLPIDLMIDIPFAKSGFPPGELLDKRNEMSRILSRAGLKETGAGSGMGSMDISVQTTDAKKATALILKVGRDLGFKKVTVQEFV